MSSAQVCTSIGCREQVAYSENVGRYVKLCQPHLDLHKQRNKVSSLRKKKERVDMRENSQKYAEVCQALRVAYAQISELKQENAKLLQSLGKNR